MTLGEIAGVKRQILLVQTLENLFFVFPVFCKQKKLLFFFHTEFTSEFTNAGWRLGVSWAGLGAARLGWAGLGWASLACQSDSPQIQNAFVNYSLSQSALNLPRSSQFFDRLVSMAQFCVSEMEKKSRRAFCGKLALKNGAPRLSLV